MNGKNKDSRIDLAFSVSYDKIRILRQDYRGMVHFKVQENPKLTQWSSSQV